MLERLVGLSVERRWYAVLLTGIAALIGVHALRVLPIDAVPDITNRQVQINTVSAALSPFEIERQVTFPVERALSGIAGLVSTRSISRNGFSQVTAVFEDDVDVYFARTQVAERLTAARESLPPGVEPEIGPVTTGLGEIYLWTVEFEHPHGEGAPRRDGVPGWQTDGSYLTPEGERLTDEVGELTYLRTVQDWIVAPQIQQVRSVAGVDRIGGYEKQIHVVPDIASLTSRGLSLDDVAQALERNNLSSGAGYIEHSGEALVVRADARLDSVARVADLAVAQRGGTIVRLGDVSRVGLGRELRTGSATYLGREVVSGTALMLVGANSRTVAAAVDARLDEVRRTVPPDVLLRTVVNRTSLVDATIATVEKNLVEGAVLVIVVLLVMLGNLRAALITALSIPLAMLLAAIGMVQAKVSGNLMSLGALDFGLIVDGSVIVVENSLRRLAGQQHELGRPLTLPERLATVRSATVQVLRATVFGQAIIVIVYVPILALTGIEGKMFQPMALTVIFALAGAFVLSVTFIPAMVALGLSGRVAEREVVFVRWLKRAYEPTLRQALRRRALVAGGALAAFVASLLVFQRLGQEFVPQLDEKNILLEPTRIPSTSLSQSTAMTEVLERRLAEFPEVAYVFSRNGTAEIAADPMPQFASDVYVMLKPQEQWPDPHETKASLIARIEADSSHLPGNNYEFTQPIQMRFNELIAGVKADLAVKVFGDDLPALGATADRVAAVLREVPGAADVKIEQSQGLPVLTVRIDHAAAARRGIAADEIVETVATAVAGREAGFVFEGDRRVPIVLRLPNAFREDPDAMGQVPVALPRGEAPGDAGPAGGFVPLRDVAAIDEDEGPYQVSRENGRRRVVVQANIRGRDLGSFVAEAQRRVRADVPLPPGSWLAWGGQFENLLAARERLGLVVPGCFLVILLLLYQTFGLWKDALLVFTGVPLALTGGVAALWMRGLPFSISAAVGFIALSGVAVLNGLVMVTFVNQLRAAGMPLEEAIRTGCLTRLRPVLMTALVASLGFVPMALATGTGAEVQRPLATVVIGGIVTSTALTLVVLPALYRMWHWREKPLPAVEVAEEEAVVS